MNSSQFTQNLKTSKNSYQIYSLAKVADYYGNIDKLPICLKIILENLIRHLDNDTVKDEDIKALVDWQKDAKAGKEIAYRPARVLMQDFTGVPAIVDLAAMREAVLKLGDNPEKVNPLSPVDLVIDHSVMVDHFGSNQAHDLNIALEMQRNRQRYTFLKWGQNAFDNFRVVPPGVGICHQVNLEFLAQCIYASNKNGKLIAYPDTLVGTDSHTTMINGLGVLGWGVGGIEAEAVMLGQPISMLIPEVVGFELTGKLNEGITATDLVLTITSSLRKLGVVGKFVEFYGQGLSNLSLADRATIANMAPEYGATCGFFPIDEATLAYLRLTNREAEVIDRVEVYAKTQGLWNDPKQVKIFSDKVSLDISTVESSLAGPKRPQDKVVLSAIKESFNQFITERKLQANNETEIKINNKSENLKNGDVVIAAITSCTNTSNPNVLVAAGLVAKKAVEKGLTVKPWVKTSLAPGSKVVTEYLHKLGLMDYLSQLGFNLVGYGCTTCIGNSGDLIPEVTEAINQKNITVASVLSGNRNFEGRVHPLVQTNWLASPPLVVAFALAGTVKINLYQDPIGIDKQSNKVYLKDIWPSNKEIASMVSQIQSTMFKEQYSDIFKGDKSWQSIATNKEKTYNWLDSTYIQHPPYFIGMGAKPKAIEDINSARILAILADSVTTDHISPAGSIKKDSPAGEYLLKKGVDFANFNSYGSRRGNHQVMMRGTFANVRIRNEMTPEIEGGFTRHIESNKIMPIYDAAMAYQQEKRALVVIAGKEYGTGSSRDWAAKGTNLLGIKAVIVESFERIHRSNLIGMGVLPLQFKNGINRKTLNLKGDELIFIKNLATIKPKQIITVELQRANGKNEQFETICRIDTNNELVYYQQGGILHYVLRKMMGLAQ